MSQRTKFYQSRGQVRESVLKLETVLLHNLRTTWSTLNSGTTLENNVSGRFKLFQMSPPFMKSRLENKETAGN